MAGLFPSIVISLLIFQLCHGTTTVIFQDLLEGKIEDLFQELVKPVIREMAIVNRTLLFIEKDLAKRRLTNPYLFMNTEENENNTCRNLPVYLPKAKQIIENAFYRCTDISGSLSDILREALKCLDINVFKTIPCLLRNVGKVLLIYKKYKPEFIPILLELKNTFTVVFEMYKDCVKWL